jgi:predicted DCC family thiol-disulfide oxidoreductase YuxK
MTSFFNPEFATQTIIKRTNYSNLHPVKTQPIILFDGVCNLCNRSVQYVIRHDPDAVFKFASLQGNTGQQLLKQFGLADVNMNSFVLIQNDRAYTRSTAALVVAKQLKGVIKLLYAFIIVPPFIRNAVYNMVSKYRYKWFGKKDTCMVPSESLKNRFLI